MFCEKCGNQLLDDMLFCPRCGSKVINYDIQNTAYVEPSSINTEKIDTEMPENQVYTTKEVAEMQEVSLYTTETVTQIPDNNYYEISQVNNIATDIVQTKEYYSTQSVSIAMAPAYKIVFTILTVISMFIPFAFGVVSRFNSAGERFSLVHYMFSDSYSALNVGKEVYGEKFGLLEVFLIVWIVGFSIVALRHITVNKGTRAAVMLLISMAPMLLFTFVALPETRITIMDITIVKNNYYVGGTASLIYYIFTIIALVIAAAGQADYNRKADKYKPINQ